MRNQTIVAVAIMLVHLQAISCADEPSFLPGVKRVVFLGDSITWSGQYVEDIDAYAATRFPNRKMEFLNLGLPSETVSGLSEPNHAGGAFPRPVLSERLGRVLKKTKPDLVVACYGMNDGIYHPFSEERFAKFRGGIQQLRASVTAAGAEIIHVTPPPFDPVPLKGHALPAGRQQYGSDMPYQGYNQVLDRYSQWLLAQRAAGWKVVDVHGPINHYLAERRRQDIGYCLSDDGIHINSVGHWLVARQLLVAFGAPTALADMESAEAMLASYPHPAEILSLVAARQRMLRDAWLTETGHLRPDMATGLPLADALTQTAELEQRLSLILSTPAKQTNQSQ